MANQNYVRSDDDGNPTVPQPASTPGTVDPGSTWETKPYLNFNGDYKRINDDGIEVVPEPYKRINDDGIEVIPASYVRTPDEP